MKQSQQFIPISKNIDRNNDIFSTRFLKQGGYINRLSSGIYTFLPLGWKLVNNINNLIRNEFDLINANEILMPVIQPVELWEKTNRLKIYDSLLFKLKDRQQKRLVLGPTHEEVITYLISNYIQSYKQLPVILYQIQTKFRDELRPRHGLLRTKEFLMFDAYSFSEDIDNLNDIYKIISQTYEKILLKLNLIYKKVNALSGEICNDISEEFILLTDIGEDIIFYTDNSNICYNLETQPNIKEGDYCEKLGGKIKFSNGLEVGHIFKLGTKYSKELKAHYMNRNSKTEEIIMGCYGIGINRLIIGILEQKKEKFKWPLIIAPYKVHILISSIRNKEILDKSLTLYKKLLNYNITVLLDDRNESLSYKIKDSYFIGSPYLIIVEKDNIKVNKINFNSKDDINLVVNYILENIY